MQDLLGQCTYQPLISSPVVFTYKSISSGSIEIFRKKIDSSYYKHVVRGYTA